MTQTLINGPQTSTTTNPEAWLMLDDQLKNTSVAVDDAVGNSVSLQLQGYTMAELAVLSDWGRLSTVAANSQGPWGISEQDFNNASNAFIISTRQQIWQGYANKLWIAVSTPSVDSAGQYACTWSDGILDFVTYFFYNFVQAGLPIGLGNGIQYWPVQSVSTVSSSGARGRPSWIPYVLFQQGSSLLPPVDAVSAIFEQPQSLDSGQTAAGAYGPWFWQAAYDLTKKVSTSCKVSGNTVTVQTTAGSFYGETSN
jgi:hypothetical protein